MGWWYRFGHNAARIAASAVWKLRVWGQDNIPSRGGVILASNHQSFLDPPLVGAASRREVHYMARKSLFRFAPFRALIVSYNAFPIERDKGDVKGVKTALRRLKKGKVLLVFPEGTRTRNGEIQEMKSGIGLIARRAGVPIVPTLIEGANKVWPRSQWFPGAGYVNITFGPVVPTEGVPDAELGPKIREHVVALRDVPHRKLEKITNGQQGPG